jgi:acetylornithine/N-succinyldiaminopimelate aminotransferase
MMSKLFLQTINTEISSVIIEGIQGVGGIHFPTDSFLQLLSRKCKEVGALLILDEVQSGYGRTGKFFAHQFAEIAPDLITVAKGMGNGFPIGGLLIHPDIKPWSGMLGTTFGGNYLACAAGLSVLEVIEQEDLMTNAAKLGEFWMQQLQSFSEIKAIRGKGLMIGFDLPDELASLRKDLLFKQSIFTGEAKPNTVRLLPSLALSKIEAELFLDALSTELKQTVSS